MDIRTNSISNLPASAVVASIATILLFISIPLLTKISTIKGDRERVIPVMVSNYKPPPPPEPEQEKRLEEMQKRETPEKLPPKHTNPKPILNFAANNLNADTYGTIQINNILKQDIKVTDSAYARAYGFNEVDKHPNPVRIFQPKYPFEAQQRGLEGKVLVRLVVDSAGMPREPEIYKVEPKEVEGVFDAAALECIMKYKFNPAMKGGKAVDCIVRIPFTFSVSE